MARCIFGRLAEDRHVQSLAYRLSDIPKRYALFRDCVIPGPRDSLLERQPVERRRIEHMHRGPAVEPVTDARTPCSATEAAACSETRGNPGAGISSSVPTRPGARPAVPEVTTKGRPEPASAEPRTSIARLSISQFSTYFEKSWIKAQ